MAEIVSSEFQSLEISTKILDTSSVDWDWEWEREFAELREKRRGRQDLLGYRPGQPRLSAVRKAHMCYGFDMIKYSGRDIPVESTWGNDYEVDMYGKLGVHCYNFQQGTNFKFLWWEKYNREMKKELTDGIEWDIDPNIKYYITLDVIDQTTNGVCSLSFQTLVISGSGCGIHTRLTTLASRIRCKEPVSCWDDTAIDEFYKVKLPLWFSDRDLATYPKRFYEVQKSDLDENDFLQLFAEIAFWKVGKLKSVEKIKKIVIETKEEYKSEAREKLKAENAIYYITYNHRGEPSFDLSGDYTAILRKTMDGNPGHMCIEVAREKEVPEYQPCGGCCLFVGEIESEE